MNLYAFSALDLATKPLPRPCAVLRMADSKELLAPLGEYHPEALMNLIFNDATSDYGLVRSPTKEDANKILSFVAVTCGGSKPEFPNFVAQCQAGIGRSQAAIAALAKIEGREDQVLQIKQNGTYNRKLYALILDAAGLPKEEEPLVSIVVRQKYDARSRDAFYLSMQKQRYQNWELIFVDDGPLERDRISGFYCQVQPGVRYISTPKPLGRWGHPYRQLGIDAAKGKYIGLNNDDNYLTPGYIEQLVLALETHSADVAMCQVCHSYSGYGVTSPGSDLCSWLARASLVKENPWTGIEFDSDAKYLNQLVRGRKVASVNRPLVVHN